jgi:hypothetical protein
MYKNKYLKYKNKYLQLKNQIGGDDIECPNNTLNMKLVVKDINKCDDPRATGTVNQLTDPDDKKTAEEGERKGYIFSNIHRNCFIKEGYPNMKERIYSYEGHINPNGEFSIATYNGMGIDRKGEQKWLIDERVPLIVEEIRSNNLDIVCFQEMSYTLCEKLKSELHNYTIYEDFSNLNYLKTDKHYIIDNDITDRHGNGPNYTNRHHDIECSVAIKNTLRPKSIIIDPLGGNITWANSLMIIEFDNLVIFNCYLQAGTKYSPGQIKQYLNYSRCRGQLLEYIITKLTKYEDKAIIILGDFNLNLNDTAGKDFPEIRIINKLKTDLGFSDNWLETHDINENEGLTENTDINLMRWNDKFLPKKTRVDGILSKNLTVKSCNLLGLTSKPVPDSKEEDFIKEFTATKEVDKTKLIDGKIDGKEVKTRLINGKLYDLTNLKLIDDKLPIFSSDHFGVFSKLSFIE